MSDANAAPRVLAGRYELGPLLGRGGMADVFRAEDRTLRRPVAVKVLRETAGDESDRARPQMAQCDLGEPARLGGGPRIALLVAQAGDLGADERPVGHVVMAQRRRRGKLIGNCRRRPFTSHAAQEPRHIVFDRIIVGRRCGRLGLHPNGLLLGQVSERHRIAGRRHFLLFTATGEQAR